MMLDDLGKKFSLLGPRTDLNGFYHGPLWMYLNYPVFVLSNGNPVMSALFWFILYIGFLSSSFFVAKKIFDTKHALIFTSLLSTVYTVPYLTNFNNFINGFYNPHGALFLTPLFLYFLYQYFLSFQMRYLSMAVFLCGLFIQFQIAFGAPILILVSLISSVFIFKHKLFRHLSAFLILIIPFSTYLMFDIRHDFTLSKSLFFPQLDNDRHLLSWLEIIDSRTYDFFVRGINVFKDKELFLNLPIGILICFAYYFVYKKTAEKKYRFLYFLLGYLYLGYFIVSLLHNGTLHHFYYLPLLPITFLIISRFPYTFGPKIGRLIIFFILLINLLFTLERKSEVNLFSGNSLMSWKFHQNMYKKIFENAPEEFGVIVRAPDIFGYASKYPILYWQKRFSAKKVIYGKSHTTYIVVEPMIISPTWSNVDYEYWLKNVLLIKQNATNITSYPNGFVVYEYKLNDEDILSKSNDGAFDWMHFR